jgi:hypothetical protein
MTPTLAQLIAAVQGAWRLMLWDKEGLTRFDMTIEGFWRSFYAPAAALPAVILVHVAHLMMMNETALLNPDAGLPETPTTGLYLAIKTSGYIGEVILFPVLMVFISRRMAMSANYLPYIIAWNWVNALIIGVLAVPHLLYLAGVISLVSIYGFQVIILGLSILCLYFTTRTALKIQPLVASIILTLSIVLGLTLEAILATVFG